MELSSYTAQDLFKWVTTEGNDFLLLDVRVEEQFDQFKVEGPYLSKMLNVPYVEFVEKEEESVAKVPTGEAIRIVCAKEGSARYVAEILVNHGFENVRYLEGGIKTWGNMLAPKLVSSKHGYKLYQFIRPGKASCSYGLIYDDEMMVFDPSRNTGFYQNFADENGCRIVKSFETHLQADYISEASNLPSRSDLILSDMPMTSKTRPLTIKRFKIKRFIHFQKADPKSRPYTCRGTRLEAHLISSTMNF
jgi:rhodanese-related sulfurtransferase